MKKLMKWLLGFYLLFFCGFGYSVCCLNGNGKEVDWWIMIKKPNDTSCAYLDSNSQDQEQWTKAYVASLDSNWPNPLKETLKKAYQQSRGNNQSLLIMYNDQPGYKNPNYIKKYSQPKENKNNKNVKKYSNFPEIFNYTFIQAKIADPGNNVGHAKGIVAFTGLDKKDSSGFWIIHSVPRFPLVFKGHNNQDIDYLYPRTGLTKAQSFLCITVPRYNVQQEDQLEKIKTSLLRTKAHIFYADRHDDKFHGLFNLEGSNGKYFKVYSQYHSKENEKDLYEYASEQLQEKLRVQSFLTVRGGTQEDKKLSSEKVQNIKSMQLDGLPWNTSQDHSKWAVDDRSEKTACFGDLNRVESQTKRGGHMACLESTSVHKFLNKMIENPQ